MGFSQVKNVAAELILGTVLRCTVKLLAQLASSVKSRGIMSGAAGGGGGSSCLGAAAAASCSSTGSPYAAAAGGGAGVAGRLPARVLEHVFSYLELTDLMRCSLVCWHWNNILADENSEVWRSLCSRTLSDEALRSDILCNLPTYKGKVGLPVHIPLSWGYLFVYAFTQRDNVAINITECQRNLVLFNVFNEI